jgi:methyl-accepting chemotaxis protein
MEKVTQTTAATAEESAAASEELNAQAETSMHVVRNLEVLIGGKAGEHTPSAKRASTHKARVVAHPAAPKSGSHSAEDAIPLQATGTFGKF